jgi:chromosome segregation ATPase
MAENNLDILKFRLDTLNKRLENENDESKRIQFQSKKAEIEKQINEKDLNYLNHLEKFLESQLKDDYELDNSIHKHDSRKTVEQTNDHLTKKTDNVVKQEKETKTQMNVNQAELKKINKKWTDIDKERNARETEYENVNEELMKNEDEIFKTDLDVQRGQKDVEITNDRIEDYGNLGKRLQNTIDNRTSDSKKKEKEGLLLKTEIDVNFFL